MIALWIILGVLLLIITGLLVSPLTLTIDTDGGIYHIQITGIGEAAIIPAWETDHMVIVRWRLWFWQRDFLPVEAALKKREKKPTKKKEKKKPHTKRSGSKKKFAWYWSLAGRLLRSFRVHYFRMDLDTNDPVWNSQLYPLAYLLRGSERKVSINFVQYNALRLKVSNRLGNILWAFIFK